MRVGNRGRAFQGGSMVWVAILMAAVPAMILAAVNLGRAWQSYRALRLATDAACQAAAEGGVEPGVFQKTGNIQLNPSRARAVGTAMFIQSLQPYAGILRNASVQISFSNTTVICLGRVTVMPFGAETLVSLALNTRSESQMRVSPLR